MQDEEKPLLERVKALGSILRVILPILSFAIPLVILYSLYPESFEATWQGRTYYLFFMWLFLLETWMNWKEPEQSERRLISLRNIVLAIALTLPAIYIVAAHYYGFNATIMDFATRNNFHPYMIGLIPLSTEYLVLTALFALVISLAYGISRLKDFSISTLFLGAIGGIYQINNLYPYGRFTPFQIIVPTTADLAARLLNLLGYRTLYLGDPSHMPTFVAWDSFGNYSAAFSIAWPCAGIESLILYTITILLFLKKSDFWWVTKIICFAVGAVVTYFINIIRIASIFIISINHGDVQTFHNYYGQLYSITWVISYPLIIMGSQLLWNRVRSWRMERKALKNGLPTTPVKV